MSASASSVMSRAAASSRPPPLALVSADTVARLVTETQVKPTMAKTYDWMPVPRHQASRSKKLHEDK
eukprot:455490-Prorocentrum_minimum.AAC.1